jgi:hypothetical protein
LIAVDSSVAMPAMLAWHESHETSRDAARGASIPAHSLVECHSVLTRLPAPHRVGADAADALLHGCSRGRACSCRPPTSPGSSVGSLGRTSPAAPRTTVCSHSPLLSTVPSW